MLVKHAKKIKKEKSYELQAASLTRRILNDRVKTMKLSDFLDKHHSRADKMRILKKMLKTAEANKSKTVSVKKARSIIFNHREGDMKI